MPGEDIEVINPSRPNAQADAWITLILRSMATGVGLSYERLARDYSRTNFSSNRASDLEDRREFRMDQRWLVSRWLRPPWAKFVESAVRAGVTGFPSPGEFAQDYHAWIRHEWQPPGWEWVDPLRQSQAAQIALESGLTSHSDELSVQGKSFASVVEQRKRDAIRLQEAEMQNDEEGREATTV